MVRLAAILKFAEEVFGNAEKANMWLHRPNKTLNGFSPIELLDSDHGARLCKSHAKKLQWYKLGCARPTHHLT